MFWISIKFIALLFFTVPCREVQDDDFDMGTNEECLVATANKGTYFVSYLFLYFVVLSLIMMSTLQHYLSFSFYRHNLAYV